MSNIEQSCAPSHSADCPATAESPCFQRIDTRDAILGEGMTIRRALPSRHRRMIGAWCFLDHAGPADVSQGDGVRVGPHPHIGLQTFTWPVRGELLHRDSLGYEQIIRPGQVNLMTAGRGISHAETSPTERSPEYLGAQLWIALPDDKRQIDPAFDHYPGLPVLDRDGFQISVLAGETLGEQAPCRLYSPLSGVDITSPGGTQTTLPLRPDFEYGALLLEGELQLENEALRTGQLLYLGRGRDTLHLRADEPARLLLLGGEPFGEEILMWWNFVGRRREEMVAATEAWNHPERDLDFGFGEVRGYDGPRMTAPATPWQ